MKKTFNTILKLLMPIFAVFSCGTLIVGFTQPIDAVEQKGVYLVATLALMGLTYLCWRWSSEPKNTL
ncbi:MAG: hypothetical protein AWU57_602 [Marinobacter sp. T13-3]|nr:MAG: hypothetical protein AWU57_602 [Marinobacter sp. T13-3]